MLRFTGPSCVGALQNLRRLLYNFDLEIKEFVLPNGIEYYAIFQIPLEKYQQEVYFYPTNFNQSVRLVVIDQRLFIVSFEPLQVNILKRKLFMFHNETNVIKMEVVSLPGLRLDCEVNKPVTTLTFYHEDVYVIWGCVDLEGTNQHEETLWFFGNSRKIVEDEIGSEALNKFAEYGQWAIDQLKSHNSAISQTDFDVFFNKINHKYFPRKYNVDFPLQCPSTN